MSLRDGLKRTGRKGVFYKEHQTRKHGVRKDRLLVLRYTLNGTTKTEVFGWLSDGFNELDAERKIAEFRANAKIGTGATSLTEERQNAEQERKAAEDAATLAAERNRLFSELVNEYIAGLTLRPKTISCYESFLAVAADYKPAKGLPTLGETLITEIPKKHLAQCIEKTAKRSPSVAVAVRSALSAFYSWLAEPSREYIEVNPVPSIRKPKANSPRERILNDREIRIVWMALGSSPLEQLIKFLLITGVRLSEALGMDRSEIDEATGWWTIPGARAKSKRPHRVYLTKTAFDVLPESDFPFHNIVKVKGGGCEYVSKPFGLAAVNHVLRRSQWYGVAKFTAHDLRRTIASGLASIGHSSDTIAAVLSHKSSSITQQHYIHHDQDAEKRRAWLAWERHLARLIKKGGEKVVNLDSHR